VKAEEGRSGGKGRDGCLSKRDERSVKVKTGGKRDERGGQKINKVRIHFGFRRLVVRLLLLLGRPTEC
jgi:hypothetical protein